MTTDTSKIKVPPVRVRTVDVRGLVYAISGPEREYPVYRFSGGKMFWERPKRTSP